MGCFWLALIMWTRAVVFEEKSFFFMTCCGLFYECVFEMVVLGIKLPTLLTWEPAALRWEQPVWRNWTEELKCIWWKTFHIKYFFQKMYFCICLKTLCVQVFCLRVCLCMQYSQRTEEDIRSLELGDQTNPLYWALGRLPSSNYISPTLRKRALIW